MSEERRIDNIKALLGFSDNPVWQFRYYLVFDGACSVMHVIPARQQVKDCAIPLKSDVMALLSLTTEGKKRETTG